MNDEMDPAHLKAVPQTQAPETAQEDPSSVVEQDDPHSANEDAVEAGDGLDEETAALIVDIEGYEGPLDVLLDLAKRQKVDLRRISMVALADQYITFVEAAKAHDLELAADYLVMAAWLAYLKSKLLMPAEDDKGDGPSADDMAARLAFQLQRLQAMQNAVAALEARPRFGFDRLGRGKPEGVRLVRKTAWTGDLVDLLKAYATQRVATIDREYTPEPPKVYSIEAARQRLERMLGPIGEWVEFGDLVASTAVDAPHASITASAFNAALEFAKNGRIDLRQSSAFAPIFIKPIEPSTTSDGENGGSHEQH